jgi:hypothetical protein
MGQGEMEQNALKAAENKELGQVGSRIAGFGGPGYHAAEVGDDGAREIGENML